MNRSLPVLQRCTGDCCRSFTLPFSPEELQRDHEHYRDGAQILGMVRYLGHRTPGAMGRRWNPPPGEEEDLRHWYTCRNLDPAGRCSIYEQRPHMCRDFPYEMRSCPYEGCTDPELRMPRELRPGYEPPPQLEKEVACEPSTPT